MRLRARRRAPRARRGSSSCRTARHARPAAGDSATAGMPVSVFSQCASVSISSSAPCTVDAGCSGWRSAKPGQPRQLLVEPRVVLHRARAERVEAAVDRVILLRQPGEMAHDLRLAEPGQADRRLRVRARRGASRDGGGSGRSTPQWPGESCSKISGSSICSPRLPLIVCARPVVGVGGARSAPGSSSLIAAPPPSAASKPSISSVVTVSVAATSSRSASSARSG